MIKTGIPKLDDYLNGGLPTGKSLLYYCQPGVEGDVFGMQTTYTNLQQGYKSVCIATASSPDVIRGKFIEFGWPLEKFENQFEIIDAYSALIGADSSEKYVVEDPENIKNLDKTITEVIEDSSGKVIIHGSISNIIDMCGEDQALEYIENWNKYIMLYDVVGIYNFTVWPYSDKTVERIKDELFNAVIRIGGVSEHVIFGQYYSVTKADWTKAIIDSSILFKVLRPGGVKAFIPKLLVTGPFNAGKSSFVQSLSTRAVSVDRMGTTVALDIGHIDHKGFSADIFGTPGQERFDPILKLLGGEAMGVFLLIDSVKSNEFDRARQMLEVTRTRGLPCVIVANKQDLPDALSIEEIKRKMEISENIPIVPAVAKEKKGVFEAFEILIDQIMVGI